MNYKFSLKKLKLRNQKLKRNLPFCFLFSDCKKISDLKKVIVLMPKNSAIIIREYDLEKSERKEFAANINNLARKKQVLSFVGKDSNLALELNCDGIHFSDFDKISPNLLKKYHQKFFISLACHSEKSLQKINNSILAKYVDVIFYSPIFATSSHENAKENGLRKFNKILRKSKKNIYALGGVSEKNLQNLLKEKRFLGFGGIDIFANYAK